MRRPPLTNRVIRGLRAALSVVDAGGPEEITGYDDRESRLLYEDVLQAVRWLDGVVAARDRRLGDESSYDQGEGDGPPRP